MSRTKNHPRYREIQIGNIGGDSSDQSSLTLGIILFIDSKKLRSHAVKHLTDEKEFAKTWSQIEYVDKELILRSRALLEKIECPHYALGIESPKCHGCPKYNLCTEFISDLENEYINLTWKVIKEGSDIPRYAGYSSRKKNNAVFVLMPNRPVVVYASLLEDNSFNLMTCYSDARRNYIEMRDYLAEKVRRRARKNSIMWCEESTWGIGEIFPSENIKRPFCRGGSTSWRQYLD